MSKLYSELAQWWQLLSPPEDYADEAAFYLSLLADVTAHSSATLLELGSGGGNNAHYMKAAFASVTLADLSPQMVAVSRDLNPDCEHLVADMRTLRLERTFDAVFIHDAIDYMADRDALREAIETTFLHLKPGGMALFAPDHLRETFESSTEHGGTDGEGRGLRYLEWSYDPDPDDMTYTTDYVVVLREEGEPVHIEHEQHILGLFGRDDWLNLMQTVGFKPDYVVDDYERTLFIGRKP